MRKVWEPIELLANLSQVPESGAMVIVSFPKLKNGSGFPARVFAVLLEINVERFSGSTDRAAQ